MRYHHAELLVVNLTQFLLANRCDKTMRSDCSASCVCHAVEVKIKDATDVGYGLRKNSYNCVDHLPESFDKKINVPLYNMPICSGEIEIQTFCQSVLFLTGQMAEW